MLTYSTAKEKMERARHGRRKLENNTYLEERQLPDGGKAYAVRLHATDVVTYMPDESVVLNSGGWWTMTTKGRINTYLPFGQVNSLDGEWFYWPKWTGWSDRNREGNGAVPFADGMRVWPGGRAEGAGQDLRPIRAKVRKMVRKYIDGYAKHTVEHGLPEPGSGDCWGCLMTLDNAPTKTGAWGQEQRPLPPGKDMMTGVSHLLSHFEENYYVPALFWRAVQRRGDPAYCWDIVRQDAGRGRTDMLKMDLRAFFKPLMPALVEELARREGAE